MSNDNDNNGRNGNDRAHGEDGDDDNDNVIRLPTLAQRDRMRREQEKQWRRQYRSSKESGPIINLPPVTKIMIASLLAIHVLLIAIFGASGQQWAFDHFGFTPAYYTSAFPGWTAFAGPLTYMLLHGSWLHVAMNTAMLMAFGAGVEKWVGGKRMLILFILCSLAAAFFHFILSPFSQTTMIGASGGVSGLFAAVLIMLQRQGRLGTGRYGILPMAALWIAISFIFGMLGSPDGSSIAWAAHIGGFVAGFIFLRPVLRMK